MDDDATELTPMPTADGVAALPDDDVLMLDDDTQLQTITKTLKNDVRVAPAEPSAFDETDELAPVEQDAFDETAAVVVGRRASTEGAWPPAPRSPALKSTPPGRRAEVFLAVPDIDLVSRPRSTDRHRATHSDWFWSPPTPH